MKMNFYVALLRGINVGGKNILPMKELIAVLENLGLTNVQTYIQSGNVVFQFDGSSPQELSPNIQAAILLSHGFAPKVTILSGQEFHLAMAANPFPEATTEPKSLHLFFLNSVPVNPDLEKLISLKTQSERFELIDQVFYLHTPESFGRSKLAANVEKSLGVALTARNWRTAKSILSILRQVEEH